MLCLLANCGGKDSAPKTQVTGEAARPSTGALETGAKVLQDVTAVKQFDIHEVGFHPMKDDTNRQMEARHYCNQVNEDFAQCVLFDGTPKQAHMNGTEYIISERIFKTFPPEERITGTLTITKSSPVSW